MVGPEGSKGGYIKCPSGSKGEAHYEQLVRELCEGEKKDKEDKEDGNEGMVAANEQNLIFQEEEVQNIKKKRFANELDQQLGDDDKKELRDDVDRICKDVETVAKMMEHVRMPSRSRRRAGRKPVNTPHTLFLFAIPNFPNDGSFPKIRDPNHPQTSTTYENFPPQCSVLVGFVGQRIEQPQCPVVVMMFVVEDSRGLGVGFASHEEPRESGEKEDERQRRHDFFAKRIPAEYWPRGYYPLHSISIS